jgi:hypothetical protein
MDIALLTLEDLAEWEPAENMTDVTLLWTSSLSIEDVLQMCKRWRQLRRLTLKNIMNITLPPLEVLCDFIMEMKHLSHLHIAPPYDGPNDGQLKILCDKVNELILRRRLNFKFDISRSLLI